MIVRRGFRRAASFHTDALRQAPVGHYFDAITNGWGAMPSYAPQIPPGDRWAIIAYIRALQVSNQNVQATGLSRSRRRQRRQLPQRRPQAEGINKMNGAYTAPAQVGSYQKRALIVGVVFLLLLALGAVLNRPQFFHSYLVGFLFWAGIPLGSLALLMLQHLTGGHWGLVIRRVLEAATRTLPLVAVLFLPIIIGAHDIYPWTHHEEMSKTPALVQKARLYLNMPGFVGTRRFVFCALGNSCVPAEQVVVGTGSHRR